jgi:IS5 family transposase
MHQTKKGNQWHFGMKAHIGVDTESGLTHTVVTTAAHVGDVTQARGCCMAMKRRPSATRAIRVSRSGKRTRTAT